MEDSQAAVVTASDDGSAAAREKPSRLGALWALVVASIIGPALMFAIGAYENHRHVIQEARQTVLRTTAILREHTLKVFETHELVLNQVDQRIQGLSWDDIDGSESLKLFLGRIDRDLEQIASLWVVDAAGDVRAGSIPYQAGLNGRDRDFFLEQRARDMGTFVGKAYIGRTTNLPSFGVSRRRTSTLGFDGIIHIAVSSAYFSDFFASTTAEAEHVAVLLRADGEVLARHPVATTVERYPEGSGILGAIAGGNTDPRVGRLSPGGDERIYAFQQVGGYPLYVVFGISQPAVLREWYANLVVYAAIALAVAMALFATSLLALRQARREQRARARLTEETERRAAAEEGLRQTQKMEALGQLTGGVAHDFNNLLTVIGGNLSFLDGRLGNEKLQRRVELGLKAVERAASLTRHLLAFARRQPLQPVVFDLNERLLDMSDLLERSLQGNVAITTGLEHDLWPVEADPQQLELAVLNVAVNARDAMPSGGRLSIRTSNLRLAEGHPSGLSGDFVALAITDTGGGIPPDIIGRVFDPFFTTKEVGKGTGLGLSQVYGFTSQSGGGATVDSIAGRGTTLTLYLPRASGPLPVQATAVDLLSAAGGARVLLVEDDPDVADVAAAMLAQLGCKVAHATDVATAIALLERGGIDLVFSDVVMPGGLGGIDLARIVQRRWRLPVLLATGFSEKASAGAEWPILVKPYRVEDLAAAIAQIGARAAAAD